MDAHGLAFPAGDSGTKGAVSFSTLETTLRVLFRNHIMYEDEVGFFRSRNRVFLVASVDWIVSVQADALPFLACHSFFIRRHPVAIAPYIARRYIEGEKEKGNDDEQGEDFEKGLQGKAFAFKCMVRLVGGDDREFVVDEEGRVVIPRAFFFLHAIAALFDNPYQDIARSGVKPGGLLYALSALLDSANPDRLFSCLFSSGSGSGSGNAPPVAAPHRDIEDTYRWIAFGSADQKEARKRAFLDVRINKTLEVTKVFPGGPEWRLTREMYSQQVTRLFTSEAGVGAGKGKDGAPLCSMDRAHFPTVYGGLLELVSAVEENNYLAHDARAGMVRPSYIPAESFHMLRFSLVDFPFMLFPGSVAVGSAPVPARAWYMRDAFPVVKEVVSTEGAQKRYTAPFCYSSWLDTVITREICDAPVDAGM